MASTAPASHTATTSRTRAAVQPFSNPKAGNPYGLAKRPCVPPAQESVATPPPFAIGLMAVDGKSKGTHMDSGTVGSAFPHARDGVLDALFHPFRQFVVG